MYHMIIHNVNKTLIYLFFILRLLFILIFFFFFQAEDGIRDLIVTGVQTCALPILAVHAQFQLCGEGTDEVDLYKVIDDAWRKLELGVNGHDFNDFKKWLGNWKRSEERRVGKECRSRWSPYH